MKIGVIGSGNIGSTLARLWVQSGHDVLLSSRHPEDLETLVDQLGPRARAGAVLEAATWGETVLLAIPFGATALLADDVVAALAGKVVLDAGNPFPNRDGTAATQALSSGRGSGAWTASKLPGARVVKAFNTVHFRTMMTEAHREEDPIGVPLAGDDQGAVQIAEHLVRDAGLEPVVVGGLFEARRFDPGTPLWNSGATAAQVREGLGLE